jgi:hypothetical protein
MNGHALKGFARIRTSVVFVVLSFQEKLGLGFCKFILIPNAVLISYWSPASFPDAGFPPSLITLSAFFCAVVDTRNQTLLFARLDLKRNQSCQAGFELLTRASH